MTMRLTDNSHYKATSDTLTAFLPLQCLANRPLSDIVNDRNCPVLIYPHSFKECKDTIANQHLFDLRLNWQGTRCKGADLDTGNLVGFIGIGNLSITINSRFSNSPEDDYFFHYLLRKVFNFNLFDLPHASSEESVFDFLLYLFPKFLNDALRQGLYKEYSTRSHNDSNIRGAVDINRHCRLNIPFNGRMAYRTREFSHDNRVTRLIRHTIEYIRNREGGSFLLENDAETRASVSKIITATSPFVKTERDKIIRDNIKPVTHPYFIAYRPLQNLCLRILRHEKIKYGDDANKIYGILFDVSYLWEEYLAMLLTPKGFHHPDNRRNLGSIFLGKGKKYPRFPDFYDRDSNGTVIDAKYKMKIDTRNDVNQMLTYMYRLKARNGIFIHPDTAESEPTSHSLHGHGLDLNATLRTYSFHIPQQVPDFKTFSTLIHESETDLLRYIRKHQFSTSTFTTIV